MFLNTTLFLLGMCKERGKGESTVLQNHILESDLDALLQSLSSDDRVGVIRPGGNHGDELIYRGLEGRLQELDIEYEAFPYFNPESRTFSRKAKKSVNLAMIEYGIVPFRFPSFGDVDYIYIHGGGNMNDMWPYVLRMLESLFKIYPETPIIVGPQSYYFENTDFGSIVKKHSSEMTLFCREEYSEQVLKGQNIQEYATVGLSPDTAFYLGKGDLQGHIDKGILAKYNVTPDKYTLLALRDDVESAVKEETVEQLSEQISGEVLKKDISTASTVSEFISLANYADYIYTDRLHGGILSAILKKDATLIENSYYKTRGVYEYSLSQYEGIEFVTSEEIST